MNTTNGLASDLTTEQPLTGGVARQAQDRVTEPLPAGDLRGRAAAVPPRAAGVPQSSRPRAAQRAAGTGIQHAAKVIAAAMSEAKLEEHIRAACKQLGILRFHVYVSRGTTPGLPDDILIGARGLLWRECKTQKGKMTPAQQATGEALTAAGQDWDVWRPTDWLSGRVIAELTAISGLRIAGGAA